MLSLQVGKKSTTTSVKVFAPIPPVLDVFINVLNVVHSCAAASTNLLASVAVLMLKSNPVNPLKGVTPTKPAAVVHLLRNPPDSTFVAAVISLLINGANKSYTGPHYKLSISTPICCNGWRACIRVLQICAERSFFTACRWPVHSEPLPNFVTSSLGVRSKKFGSPYHYGPFATFRGEHY